MPVRSDDPLRRVTLNLYESDCAALTKRHGHGWTTHIREVVHRDATSAPWYHPEPAPKPTPRTLGDLADD